MDVVAYIIHTYINTHTAGVLTYDQVSSRDHTVLTAMSVLFIVPAAICLIYYVALSVVKIVAAKPGWRRLYHHKAKLTSAG